MGRESRRDKTVREMHREHTRSDPNYQLSRTFKFCLAHPWIGWLFFTARWLTARGRRRHQAYIDRLYFVNVAFYD